MAKQTITKSIREACENLGLGFKETQAHVKTCKNLKRGADRRAYLSGLVGMSKGVN